MAGGHPSGAAAWNWRIVLVRPRNPLNIGAAARALANFGFGELWLVEAYRPSWEEARSAVGGEDVLRSARAVDRLEEAVGECSLALGTTAGSRRNLAREVVSLADLPAWLAKRRGRKRGRAALLFGSEKTGLSNEEMSHCHALVRIPTVPESPSMNLGQAVAVCCYELAREGLVSAAATPARARASDRANLHSLEHLFERAAAVLDQVGYLQPKSRGAMLLKLRRLLLDLGLTNYDVRVLGGILAQIEWKLRQ
jgi:TrmH family RNA methyltransferase